MLKESYFTAANIERQASQFLESVIQLRNKHQWTLNPSSSALLVLDMQDFFLQKDSHAYIPSAIAIVPNINRLQELFYNNNCPIIQTRHINDPTNASQMAKWWNQLMTEDNPLSQLSNSIQLKHAQTIDKIQYDAFYETSLQQKLKVKKVTQVFITGVMTHLCCETTARSAFMRGFEVFFIIDATATYNRQFHSSTLLNLTHGFAIPMLAREVLKNFREPK